MSSGWHSSWGVLCYSNDGQSPKLIVTVDPGIVDLARALCPVKLNKQKYAPHISVVRHEIPPDMTLWGLGDGERTQFQYSPIVHNDEKYYWLNVISPELKLIRLGLGLPESSIKSRPPDGTEMFHCTIGNTKFAS